MTSLIFTLFGAPLYVDPPRGLLGWVGWLLFFIVILLLLWKWKGYNKTGDIPLNRRIFLIGGLLLGQVFSALFIGLRMPVGSGMPPPGMPVDPQGPATMIFIALPWMLAGGLLGPLGAAGLAFLAGLLQAFLDTHNLFTPLEFALLAILFSTAMCQRYRTSPYRLLRHPLVSAALLAVAYPLLYLITTPFITQGILATRLDYALAHMWSNTLARGIELLMGGLVTEILVVPLSRWWGGRGPLQPAPNEKSLQARFLYAMAPLFAILVLTLMVGDWIVAGNAAREMLQKRMAGAAEMASQGVPFFLEAGQNLIAQLAADPQLYSASPEQLPAVLSQDIRTVPFFNQLYILDSQGKPVTGYPHANYSSEMAPVEEQSGILMALNGVPYQTFTIAPAEDKTTAQVSFMALLKDENKAVRGILIGRSDLSENPFTEPILASLANLAESDGEGLLLDENGRILSASDPNLVMNQYTGQVGDEALFYDDTAPNGTRQLVYYQPSVGRPWAVVLTVPAHRAQELALQIAAPLLGIILVLSVLAIFFLRISLRTVTGSLENLAAETSLIAQGKLDRPLPVEGEDEVGNLRRAFEHMRVSLKARLDELNRLLVVSQGVASSLEVHEAVRPVLESSLVTGACAARIVLAPAVVPELDGAPATPFTFGMGPAGDLYADLDEQILALTRHQDRIVMTSPNRPRLLTYAPGSPRPEALMAIALRHENLYYGTLWVAYDRPHMFSDEEVRFLVTLAGQAALAAANARLFLNAEIGRQRLAAILASTPDPVLVTDQHNRLLLANPAAWQVLKLGKDSSEGQPLERMIDQQALVTLLQLPPEDGALEKQSSVEITVPGDRVYLATASSVIAEGQRVGRVCVMRDVTHFKELDAMKSEFVATVSHDLRSPLTLMRGYATMLEMVGTLNDQQVTYARKIIDGVESMSRLVNNLLDLGRIETGVGLQLEMVPILDVVERVVGGLQLEATQKRIQLNCEIAPQTIPLIDADQALLQQALHNLIENAIKYTRPEGKVTVRVGSRQERITFEVGDTGIGIAPMDQPRLFEKFYRGAQESSKERGTGLGLAIVKSIAERHGGQVWVESQLGKGSTFYLSIPVHQERK